ncbi:hypothetical protein BN946_scf184940.g82 [Trametes cinnabarina]|uniref:TERF2-interacting telomeric protein 1 Myb domain-containing protein n=1 Tax=Pycnoporus cinnabarinus TaxID=5643 RepID=A0A060SC50_PYCCI|nr:hypothetical protein BN946_scf184940.g82 [Trametes cinnabarina]
MGNRARAEFTPEQDKLLAKYIAKYNPDKKGRLGRKLYERLVENTNGDWPFAKYHTWQSWRERYRQNEARFEPMIQRYISRYHSDVPAKPPPPQSSTQQDGKERVFFSRGDDDRLIEYLATHQGDRLLGQKFWKTMEEKVGHLAWFQRHTWQSWRERYKKNNIYFDWAVLKHLGMEVPNEPPMPPPKTVEEHVVKNPASEARAAVLAGPSRRREDATRGATRSAPEKRRRSVASDIPAEERPAKKQRAAKQIAVSSVSVVADAAGPSRSVPNDTREAAAEDADIEHRDHGAGPKGPDTNQREGQVESACETAKVESDEESDEEELLGSPGPDDYDGEIFRSPRAEGAGEDDCDDRGIVSDSAKDEQEEFDELLVDDEDAAGERQDEQDEQHDWDLQDRMDTDHLVADNDVASEAQDISHRDGTEAPPEKARSQDTMSQPSAAPQDPSPGKPSTQPRDHLPSECTEAHTPPPRKHNSRIRTTEVPLLTPELSPSEEAAARHHEPRPLTTVRRHPKRIKKPDDDDFFGTPPLNARSASPGADDADQEPSSPTAEAGARHHAHGHDRAREQELNRPKVRQPPRLDEGAFNKAFSDARGRPRISPSGKPRRRSDVDLEDTERTSSQGSPDGKEEGEDGDEEHGSDLEQSSQRSSGKGQARAPASSASTTPSPLQTPTSKGKAPARTVTEEFVSVRTVRTVERRINRRPVGKAAGSEDEDADVAQIEAQPDEEDDESSAKADGMEVDSAEDDNGWLSPSQHHPFSQAPHPFSQKDERSPVRPASRTTGLPLSKADLSRLQRLLHPHNAAQEGEAVHGPTLHAEKQPRSGKSAQLAEADRARLEKILRMEGKFAFPGPSKGRQSTSSGHALDVSSAQQGDGRIVPDAENAALFTRRATSPLAGRGAARSGSAERRGEIVPPSAAGSSRVDKGKRRADAVDSDASSRRYTIGSELARDVLNLPGGKEVPARSRRRASCQSLPPVFSLGDEGLFANRSALSLALRPPPFTISRAASVPSTTALSRSVSPLKSADISLADTLPPQELEMVKELGMTTALHIMARNHGFSEETVRQVYAITGSLEVADNVLREMREGANEKASEALTSLMQEQGDDGGDVPMEDDAQSSQESEDFAPEEAEVERELTEQPDWLPDGPSFDFAHEAPLAESSRIDASHVDIRDTGSQGRKKRPFRIERLAEEHSLSVDSAYSPPKHTRAGQIVREARQSLGQPRPVSAPPDVSAAGRDTNGTGPRKETKRAERDVAFGDLARLGSAGWKRLEDKHGKGFAKLLAAKALAKLLQQ